MESAVRRTATAMISRKTGRVVEMVEALWASGSLTGLTDAQLLQRFARCRGRDAAAEAAFEELLHRHGALVLGVCRQILRNRHDVEDAFQATFLVLVRKADSIRVGDSLAPWLYGVAVRTAHRARNHSARYRGPDLGRLEEPSAPATDDAFHFDVRPLLHEELSRLPGKFRDPITLCHLEGKSHEEAARLLRWPVGTVSSRLARGRQLLRSRLERRGVAIPTAIFSASWLAGTSTALPIPLLKTTLSSASGLAGAQTLSPLILSLTKGVLRTMWLNKIRNVAAAALLIGVTTGTVGVWAHWSSGATTHVQKGLTTPAQAISPAQDANSAPSPAQPSNSPNQDNAETKLADCPCSDDCDAPPYCPITLATHAFTRFVGYFHQSSASSR
jgi:RNA polymerase sigma factor (sigma-70 family)